MRAERKSREFDELLRGAFGELGMRVESGTDRRAADREIVDVRERFLDRDHRAIELHDVARELLTERERRRVLEVRAADLHDIGPGFRLRVERVAERLDRRQHIDDRLGRRHVHRGRKRVVRGLRHVHVVVGMDGLLRAHLAARELDRPVRDHFVDVHVRLRSGARLPDAERKVRVEIARDYFVRGAHDEIGFLGVELAEVAVDERAGLFERRHRADDLARHHVARRLTIADIEIHERARGLRSIILVDGDRHGPHGVGLRARRDAVRNRYRSHAAEVHGAADGFHLDRCRKPSVKSTSSPAVPRTRTRTRAPSSSFRLCRL